jgi:hypothetical protein
MEAAAPTTERGDGTPDGQVARTPARRAAGPDRASVVLFSVAAFLGVLALLAWELRSAPATVARRHEVVLRRVYQTTVVETVTGSTSGSGTSVSQSVSSSGSSSISPPTTRSSSSY